MSSRCFVTAFLVAVFLAGGSSCGRPAQNGRALTTSSSASKSQEARLVATSDIKKDEDVVFYPTYAYQAGGEAGWAVTIHGSIFEPELGSLKRTVALELLCTSLGLPRQQAENETFRQRARAFLVDNERGKNVSIRLGDKLYGVGTSEANGHFSATLRFAAAEADRLCRGAADREGWLGFRAVTRRGDDRNFAGRVQWIGPEGCSVISDIDDTIKISNVQDREALLANTFLREFRPVPEMAALYGKWADAGAVFHYVSASPWQLHEPLAEFCRAEGFPAGTFHMKLFRVKDSSALSFFGSQEGYKTKIIEKILADFPGRNFTLLGDSGEKDPEVYAAAARKHPEQVQHVFIRNVGGSGSEPARFQKAFEAIPASRWKVFEKPDELPEKLVD
jgi:hypothetical protein